MSFAVVRRISDAMYAEIAFQALYGLRSGNILADDKNPPTKALALRRVRQSKLLVCLLLGLVALAVPTLLGATVEHVAAPYLPYGIYRTGVFAALLVLDLALLWWTSLQVLPTLLGARVQAFAETLPVDDRTLDRAALLTTLRLFDAPMLTVLLVTPLVVGVSLGSVWAALAILPGALAVLMVALGLALRTGEFYVRHVVGAPGGGWSTALRWLYHVLWALPAFALFGFITFSPQFFGTLEYLYRTTTLVPLLGAILSVFPFPLAALPLYAAGSTTPEVDPVGILLAALVYVALLVPLAAWMVRAPRRLAREVATNPGPAVASPGTALRPRSVPGAVLWKDLRVASRTPGFAFLLLLPILDAAALGIWSFVGSPTPSQIESLGIAAVGSSALLAVFFAPAFFAVEVVGFSYTRSLPIPRGPLLAGKIALVVLIFGAAAALVLGLTALAVPTWGVAASFAVLALAELPAILAAALLQFGLLFHRAGRRGLPITGLYAGTGWVLLVAIPGLFVAGAPLVSLEYLRHAGAAGPSVLSAMSAISLLELALVAPATLRILGRGSL